MGDLAETGEVRAAGTVMWRAGDAAVQVALVHRPRYDDWSFPKGKALPGEHPLLTAVREVTEETAIRPVLGRPLGRTTYEANGRPKRVDYWAATPAPWWAGRLSLNGGAGSRAQAGSGSSGEPEFVPNDEVDKLEWLPVEVAARRLRYERDVGLLRKFASAPAATQPYIFLRHASAEDKQAWPDGGLLRPLDETGRGDAWALADLLSCFGLARVFSSAAARCVETVLPYSVLAGVRVTAEPVFAVDPPAGDYSAHPARAGTPRADAAGGVAARAVAAAARLAELLADDAPMILCGHRENLPTLQAQAARHFGAQPPAEMTLAKGSFGVLHVTHDSSGARLVATERHDITPPP
jgi:8-oxo-dGTP pyrophosphatase MutT (NUDIX family)